MNSLLDQIELDVLAETGDADYAEMTGVAVRYAWGTIIDMMGSLLGLGPAFSIDIFRMLED